MSPAEPPLRGTTVFGVRFIDTLVVTPQMRTATRALIDRLGPYVVHAGPKWVPLVEELGLGTSDDAAATPLVVGSPADILGHVLGATADFGFIVPVAQITRRWQRTPRWRDETMLDLWATGWTPVAIDRVVIAKRDAAVEFVIGNARPTPAVIEA